MEYKISTSEMVSEETIMTTYTKTKDPMKFLNEAKYNDANIEIRYTKKPLNKFTMHLVLLNISDLDKKTQEKLIEFTKKVESELKTILPKERLEESD